MKKDLEEGVSNGVELSNCFASTYALLESMDTLTYNLSTISESIG